MALAQSLSRLVASLITIGKTRAELVAVEIEEEALRYFSYLISSLIAFFCAGVAVLLGIFLIVAIYWDTHRIGVLLSLMTLFGVASFAIGFKLRQQFRHKPRLLHHTITELSRDVDTLTTPQ